MFGFGNWKTVDGLDNFDESLTLPVFFILKCFPLTKSKSLPYSSLKWDKEKHKLAIKRDRLGLQQTDASLFSLSNQSKEHAYLTNQKQTQLFPRLSRVTVPCDCDASSSRASHRSQRQHRWYCDFVQHFVLVSYHFCCWKSLKGLATTWHFGVPQTRVQSAYFSMLLNT